MPCLACTSFPMGDAPVYRHVGAGSPPEATEGQRYPHRRRTEFELLAADLKRSRTVGQWQIGTPHVGQAQHRATPNSPCAIRRRPAVAIAHDCFDPRAAAPHAIALARPCNRPMPRWREIKGIVPSGAH